MWNDEDNNPYGSFDRRDSNSSDLPNEYVPNARAFSPESPQMTTLSSNSAEESGFEPPSVLNSADSSPPIDSPEFISQSHKPTDNGHGESVEQRSGNLSRKKGGYDSRVERILCENEDLQIVITDAGKSQESGASYIVYTIKTGVSL